MRITTEPRSDQWNADDFIGGPRDFTIAVVNVGTAEQKYDIHLEGEKRVWRPPLTMLRLLVAAWGDDATVWAGRRVRLYRDPDVPFGREKVGGIRVSHASHLPGDKRLSVKLTETRGKRKEHHLDPLPDAPPAAPAPTPEQIAECIDETTLRNWWIACPDLRDVIQARVAEVRLDAERAAQIDAEAGAQ